MNAQEMTAEEANAEILERGSANESAWISAEDKWIAKYRSALDAVPVQQVAHSDLRASVGQLVQSIASRIRIRIRQFIISHAGVQNQPKRSMHLADDDTLSRKAAG